MYFNVDNARVSSSGAVVDDAMAQAIRIFGTARKGSEFILPPSYSPFWVYMCVPADSTVTMSGWKIGDHERFFQDDLAAHRVEWFAQL